jgi:hypothetical protein
MFTSNAASQIPNASFEETNFDGSLRNWGNVYLSDVWIDSTGEVHGDSTYLDFAYYFQTDDAYNGAWAAEMRNSYNDTLSEGIAGAITADIDSVYSAWGSFETIPLEAPPSALGFFYKHASVDGDSASAEITVYDSLGNEIGFGRSIIANSTLAYFHTLAQIEYTSTEMPASAMIKFSNFYTLAPGIRQPALGSRFVVDDVQLYNITGFDFLSRKQLDVMAYPNPTSERVSIRRNTANKALMKIHALNGHLVKQQVIQGELVDISLSDLCDGAYVIEVIAGEKSWKQQLIVQH